MIQLISCEFVLKSRPNGGSAVLIRSVLISIALYAVACGLKARLSPGATWQPDWTAARALITESIPWLGAIFAGIYAALYARFASQWNYLANLYNQIMATSVQTPPEEGTRSAEILRMWQAGFIEDAEELHLATKPMFASVIRSMLDRKPVRDAFIRDAPGGSDRLSLLEAKIDISLTRAAAKYKRKSTSAAPSPEPVLVAPIAPPNGV